MAHGNSEVETFFKTLKPELVWRTMLQTRAAAKAAIGRYIDRFYEHHGAKRLVHRLVELGYDVLLQPRAAR